MCSLIHFPGLLISSGLRRHSGFPSPQSFQPKPVVPPTPEPRHSRRSQSSRRPQNPVILAEASRPADPRTPSFSPKPVIPAFGGDDWVRGESRGTSGIAFIISTSNNGTTPFVPLTPLRCSGNIKVLRLRSSGFPSPQSQPMAVTGVTRMTGFGC